MVTLPPRRDSEKDTLANYTPGAAVEKKNNNISVFQFSFVLHTHTPLNGIRAGFPTESSLVFKKKKKKQIFSTFYLYKVQLELILITQAGCRKGRNLPLPSTSVTPSQFPSLLRHF